MKQLVFIVEDEENIRDLIAISLGSAGFETQTFEDGKGFFQAMETKLPSLIMLDIMLTGESGYEILKQLKAKQAYEAIPVIFLTAKSNELDKVIGLDLGADDFIVKPFGVLELISRVKAVSRRYHADTSAKAATSNTSENMRIAYKDLDIRLDEKAVFRENVKLPITYKEYELLLYLIQNKGIVLSREQLLAAVWGYDFNGETRTVDSHIKSLRNKIGDNSDNPKFIATIRGHGYMFLKET